MCHQDLVMLTKVCSLLERCFAGDIDLVFSFPAQLHCSQFLVTPTTHDNVRTLMKVELQ